MFKKLEVNGVHTKLDDDIKEYVNKKIGGLDIYLSSHSVKSAHVEVFLKEVNRSDNNSFQCEVEIHLPKQNIFVKENALSLKAAVDVSEGKLKTQLKKYKDAHEIGKNKRHLIGRFIKKTDK